MVVERFLDALCWRLHWRGCDFRAVTERPHRAADALGESVLVAALLFLWMVFRHDKN